jgi:hypothetical protein
MKDFIMRHMVDKVQLAKHGNKVVIVGDFFATYLSHWWTAPFPSA